MHVKINAFYFHFPPYWQQMWTLDFQRNVAAYLRCDVGDIIRLCSRFRTLSSSEKSLIIDESLTKLEPITSGKYFWDRVQCESKYLPPPRGFLEFFPRQLKINQNFTRLLYVYIYAKLQNFIQLPPTVTKWPPSKCFHFTTHLSWVLLTDVQQQVKTDFLHLRNSKQFS